jgi:hypothetical protein
MKKLSVGPGHPTQEVADAAVLSWLEQKMPMTVHWLFSPLGKDAFEGVEVGVLFEKPPI